MLIATTDTAYLLDADGSAAEPELIHSGARIRAATMWEGTAILALDGSRAVIFPEGVPATDETGVTDLITSLVAVAQGSARLLIGTEPPHLYTWAMAESPARRNESFASLGCRSEWHTPWGGPAAVRSLAATSDGWVYADIHVGSVMRSPDAGQSWEPVTPELHEDVHQVAVSPAAPDRVYANTANGVWVSDDRGQSWQHRAERRKRYGRAIAVHPHNPDLLLCTVSDGPHGDNVHGALYRSTDSGRTWTHVTDGFPASTTNNINTFQVVFDHGGTAWAAVDAVLYRSGTQAKSWQELWRAPDDITILAT